MSIKSATMERLSKAPAYLTFEKDVPEDGGAETIKALVAEEGYKKHIILRHNVDRLEHCYIDTVD